MGKKSHTASPKSLVGKRPAASVPVRRRVKRKTSLAKAEPVPQAEPVLEVKKEEFSDDHNDDKQREKEDDDEGTFVSNKTIGSTMPSEPVVKCASQPSHGNDVPMPGESPAEAAEEDDEDQEPSQPSQPMEAASLSVENEADDKDGEARLRSQPHTPQEEEGDEPQEGSEAEESSHDDPEADLPPGLADREAMERWAETLMDTLHASSLFQKVVDATSHGCTLRTDYSGIGTAEVGLVQLMDAFKKTPPCSEWPVTCISASDCDEQARMFLRHHEGESAPAHIFGDLKETLMPKTVAKIQTLVSHYMELAEDELAYGFPRGEIFTRLGRECMSKAAEIMLSTTTLESSGKQTAWCFKCHRQCPLTACAFSETETKSGAASSSTERSRPLSLAVAGVCCYSWSSMGKRKQWLDQDASIAFLAWTRLRLLCAEDVILVENVPGFDVDLLCKPEFFGSRWNVDTIRSTPKQLGYPALRGRKYILMIKKTMAEASELGTSDMETKFGEIFHRKCILAGADSAVLNVSLHAPLFLGRAWQSKAKYPSLREVTCLPLLGLPGMGGNIVAKMPFSSGLGLGKSMGTVSGAQEARLQLISLKASFYCELLWSSLYHCEGVSCMMLRFHAAARPTSLN